MPRPSPNRLLAVVSVVVSAFGCGSSADSARVGDFSRVGDGGGDRVADATPDAPDAAPDAGDDAGAADATVDGGLVITPELCAQWCQVMLQISCGDPPAMDDCVSQCVDGQPGAPCNPQAKEYFACIVAAGPQVLECDESQGFVTLKFGFCTEANDAFTSCLESN